MSGVRVIGGCMLVIALCFVAVLAGLTWFIWTGDANAVRVCATAVLYAIAAVLVVETMEKS
jgi:hypothetical protein